MTSETWARVTGWAAFLMPALALLPGSGYAWGTALLIVATLLAAPKWLRDPFVPSGTWWLVFAIVLMALVWLHGSDWRDGAGALNKPSRYVFALPCLFYALRFPPQPRYLFTGIMVGAAIGGLFAVRDVAVLGLDRAWIRPEDTSNAIQLGDLSGLMGVMCWLQLMVFWRRWRWPLRAFAFVCCMLGLLGLLLSETRGGWLALALCVPFLLWLLGRQRSWRAASVAVLLLLAALVPISWSVGGTLQQRLQQAVTETLGYENHGRANTSVGQRLDHWQLAWAMGLEKPLAGWGEAGYTAEKTRRVAAGQAHPIVLEFGHAHNEILDQFAKRGLIGVVGLLVLYLVPLVLFWPGRRRRHRGCGAATDPSGDDASALCLRLTGVSIPIGFAGFGLTQVYFAHYNGVISYLILVMLIFAAIRAVEPNPAVATAS